MKIIKKIYKTLKKNIFMYIGLIQLDSNVKLYVQNQCVFVIIDKNITIIIILIKIKK